MTVVICGAEMITAHGDNRATVFGQMLAGVVANGPVRRPYPERYRFRHAYEIADMPAGVPAQGRSTGWLLRVIASAMRDAKVDLATERLTILIGTGLREQSSLENWHVDGAPFSLRDWDYAEAVRQRVGAEVEVQTFVNACAATLCCLTVAKSLLELDDADAVVVAGTDSLTSSMYGLLDRVSGGDAPERIQPFDLDRRGVLMGEGAAAVVLRRADDGPGVARLAAAVQNCDGRHETAPAPDSIAELIESAHRTAGVAPDKIDLVLAHGTGTLLNDEAESEALKRVFGAASGRVLLSGTKGMTGHTAGPSGLINLITGLDIMNSGMVPPAPGLHRPLPNAACFDLVTIGRRDARIDRFQVNAFGFGGVNAVAIVERANGD